PEHRSIAGLRPKVEQTALVKRTLPQSWQDDCVDTVTSIDSSHFSERASSASRCKYSETRCRYLGGTNASAEPAASPEEEVPSSAVFMAATSERPDEATPTAELSAPERLELTAASGVGP